MANCDHKCFLSLIIEALGIKKKFKLYKIEKEIAKCGSDNVTGCICKVNRNNNTVSRYCRNRILKKDGFIDRLLSEGSVENYILKSIFGFIGGVALTYVCFMFLVFSLNFTLKRATYICICLGLILSLGLAFSVRIRCTVFLCIPQLFSKRGRQALLAYAFILALSGPAKNTLHNVEVMSESLACGQEQLKQVENELLKCVQKPNAAAKKSIEKLLEKINFEVKDFKNFIVQLYKDLLDILETVYLAQKWLYSITFLCNKKMGNPTQRCLDLLNESVENCECITPLEDWVALCQIEKCDKYMICSNDASAVCFPSDLNPGLSVPALEKKLNNFRRRAMNIFNVRVKAQQRYSQSNHTSTYHEEYQGMATEIRQKTDQFLQYFDVMSVIFGIFILVLFIKVIIYRHKFLTEDCYDNRFITTDFIDIDKTRAEFRMETLLPLEPREKMNYIKVTSIRLLPCEKVRLLSSFVFLIFATFKIIIHMLTDSSLYWILYTIRREERLLYMNSMKDEEESTTAVRVIGKGMIAAFVRNVTKVLKQQSIPSRLDPTPCLPDPIPPDYNRYYQILALVLICWLLALCEPYGLRLRHTVMVTYHPVRARERAIWLYNKIFSNRTGFVKIARKELRRKYRDIPQSTIFSFRFMREDQTTKCLLCKAMVGKKYTYFRCRTANCVGTFCNACFESLKYCSICDDSGEPSDLSEEKDSSGDEASCRCNKKKVQYQKERNSGALYLNLKKPHIAFRVKGLKKWFRKNDKPEKVKNVSDLESSDWEPDNSVNMGDSSSEDLHIAKKAIVGAKAKEAKEKIASTQTKPIKSPRKGQIFREKVDNGTAIQLFRKVSTRGILRHRQSPNQLLYSRNNLPEFWARRRAGFVCENGPFFKIPETLKSHSSDEESVNLEDQTTFLSAKDSLQLLRTKKLLEKKRSGATDQKYCINKTSFGSEKETQTAVLDYEQFLMQNNCGGMSMVTLDHRDLRGIHFASDPAPKTISDPKMIRQFYPSVTLSAVTEVSEDNTHQENPLQEGLVEKYPLEENALDDELPEDLPPLPLEKADLIESLAEERRCDNVVVTETCVIQNTTPQIPASYLSLTPSRTRVCLGNYDSSDSMTNLSHRICMREESTTSSYESDSQFYSQPYGSEAVDLRAEVKDSSNLKRTSGELNLNPPRYSKYYSVETDSSNEKFLSVKPTRRVRRKLKKPKNIEEKSDFIVNILARYSRKKHSKKVDFLKARLVRYFKKNLKEKKSSDEKQSSDVDDIEYTEHTAVFLSDKEFQKISKRLYAKAAGEKDPAKVKLGPWSRAPDLLSDLPMSRRKGSGNSTA